MHSFIAVRRIPVFIALISILLLFSYQSFAEDENSQYKQVENRLSKHPWQIQVFAQGGFPPDYRVYFPGTNLIYQKVNLELFSAGVGIGKQTRRYNGPSLLRGRGEALLEVMPLWLARYPSQTLIFHYHDGTLEPTEPLHWDGANIHGASVTPFLLRWNFSQHDSTHVVPWAQFGGGLLWTNHKFPDTGESTSVINFTPQVGAGVNIFNRPKHSVNFAMKAIHYSNAGLGDFNPGVKLTFQFSAGYSWWR